MKFIELTVYVGLTRIDTEKELFSVDDIARVRPYGRGSEITTSTRAVINVKEPYETVKSLLEGATE